MISYPRSEFAPSTLEIRVIGVGNAGVHLADRITMLALPGLSVAAANTDTQSLASSVCAAKAALGPRATRGLGAGGDPEVGFEAGGESVASLKELVGGAQIVFLLMGLGGGTGSGAGPVAAEAAREAGATVFSLVTSPFEFEGRRRAAQAASALAALARHSHSVIHFENDRMAELAAPRSGIEETFSAADALLTACVTSLVQMLRGGGPMPVGLTEILTAAGGGSAHALFGRGESKSDNRAHEALERALKSPLLDRGRLLGDTHAVIAHIAGPATMSFSEVAAIMRELNRHIAETAAVFLGVTTLPDPAAALSVTLLGNYQSAGQATLKPAPERRKPEPVVEKAPVIRTPPPVAPQRKPDPLFPDEPGEVAPSREPEPAAKAPRTETKPKVRQETLQFEPVARGRFEKSEPTIVEGEDLDVPTFLRMRNKG